MLAAGPNRSNQTDRSDLTWRQVCARSSEISLRKNRPAIGRRSPERRTVGRAIPQVREQCPAIVAARVARGQPSTPRLRRRIGKKVFGVWGDFGLNGALRGDGRGRLSFRAEPGPASRPRTSGVHRWIGFKRPSRQGSTKRIDWQSARKLTLCVIAPPTASRWRNRRRSGPEESRVASNEALARRRGLWREAGRSGERANPDW